MKREDAVEPCVLAQQRLTQIFKFLKGLTELRNPVARNLDDYAEVLRIDAWPCHPFVKICRGDLADSESGDEGGEMEPPISVRRADLTPCNPPPDALADWIVPGWHSIHADIAFLEARNSLDEDGETVTTFFADDPTRVAALERWKMQREQWIAAERPAIAARQLFERIHTLWTAIQREGERVELVLADGMLVVATHRVRHPVLIQRVSLEFDPAVPEFHFVTGTEKVELQRSLLRLVPEIDGRMIAHFSKELDDRPVDLLGGESTTGFLRTLIQGIFSTGDGEFLEEKASGRGMDRPALWREPVLLLRPRVAGLSTTIDSIIEDLRDSVKVTPSGLIRIAGIETEDASPLAGNGSAEPKRVAPSGPPLDILFSKPANAEQFQIAERLAQTQAVLVQGPPGTGKTHTIANLLGTLLAQGKTVLVTAHTTKALRVLRGQIDRALQPLCLSVLESSAEGQNQLALAAQEIASRLSNSNAAALRREAGELRENRRVLLGQAAEFRRQLRDARFSELDEIVLDGEGVSPIEAARRVKEFAVRDGWIPGPLRRGTSCPLSDAETRELYATQAVILPADATQLAVAQPDLAELVSSADFRLLASERAGMDVHAAAHRPELWTGGVASEEVGSSNLRDIHQGIVTATRLLAGEERWLREVLFAGWCGGELREAWADLLSAIKEFADEEEKAYSIKMRMGPELPDGPGTENAETTLQQIVAHLEGGGSFGLMTKLRHRNWHELIAACRVEGREPRTAADFRALLSVASMRERRRLFLARWSRSVEGLGGPSLKHSGEFPARTASGHALEVRQRLDWRASTWEPLVEALKSGGFRWEEWIAAQPMVAGDHGELERVRLAVSPELAIIVEAQAALLKQEELAATLQNQHTYLARFPQSEAANVLLEAQSAWDIDHYQEASMELARLEGLRSAYEARGKALAKMQAAAPSWAQCITQRRIPHDAAEPPGEVASAWRWRQWQQELDRRAGVSMPEIQERLDRTEKALRGLAAQIIECETWAAQCERTEHSAKMALEGFVLIIKKIGKGTGKQVPQLLREARALLATARSAVPVWIMPLSRVYESFDPRVTKFDVVIIDEASQSDVTALAALYLGRELVVVGDHEQVTPDAVG